MASTENGSRYNERPFSVGGVDIGGPTSLWSPILREGQPVENAWEFVNTRTPEGTLPSFIFRFPQKSLSDVYLDIDGANRWFTVMGGNEAILGMRWQVSKIQLYLNHAEWDSNYQNGWAMWEDKGDEIKRGQWYKVDYIPKDKVEKVYKVKKSTLKKGGIAAAVLVGAAVLANANANKQTNPPANYYFPSPTPITEQGGTTPTRVPIEIATQTPLEIPTEIPTITPTSEVQTPIPLPFRSKPIQKGETISASKGDMISGDVWINGQKYSDSIKESGEIIILDQDAQVTAPDGASLFYDVTIDVNLLAQQEQQNMLTTGCGLQSGCSYVDIITFPEQAPQGQ